MGLMLSPLYDERHKVVRYRVRTVQSSTPGVLVLVQLDDSLSINRIPKDKDRKVLAKLQYNTLYRS